MSAARQCQRHQVQRLLLRCCSYQCNWPTCRLISHRLPRISNSFARRKSPIAAQSAVDLLQLAELPPMASATRFPLLLLLLPLVAGEGLTDAPLVASAHQSLSGSDGPAWSASSSSAGLSVKAQVPGDLITDLERAGKIGDPLYERNFKSVLWDATNWTFSTDFEATATVAAADEVYLVLCVHLTRRLRPSQPAKCSEPCP
jgi:hypothetical protein